MIDGAGITESLSLSYMKYSAYLFIRDFKLLLQLRKQLVFQISFRAIQFPKTTNSLRVSFQEEKEGEWTAIQRVFVCKRTRGKMTAYARPE